MSLRRRRQPVRTGGSTRSAILAGLVLATASAACGGTARSTTTATTPASAAVSSTTTLAPVDGALQVRVEGRRASPPEPVGGPPVDDVLLVGDSVLVLVADDLAGMIDATLHIDGVDCRTLATGFDGGCGDVPPGVTVESGIDAATAALAELRSQEVVPDAAVFVLANNSTLAADDLDALMSATAGVGRVWWVNTRIEGFGRQDPNNRMLEDLAARDPRAGVIDWYSASEDRDWLADHVHPDDAGQRALARLIADHVECGCER